MNIIFSVKRITGVKTNEKIWTLKIEQFPVWVHAIILLGLGALVLFKLGLI
jgi:hypothetical protein